MGITVDEFLHGNVENYGIMSKCDLAEAIINLKGQPLSLANYVPMQAIHNDGAQEILLLAGRQVSKSVSIMIKLITNAATNAFYSQLYCTPLKSQMSKFSNLYINDTIKFSPVLRDFMMKKGGDTVKNISLRSFTNGSVLHFAYCMLSADRVRGTSADHVYLDEVQDMIMDIVPVILSCMKASKFRRRTFSGTPKTFDNTIEGFWRNSTKYEWAMKCPACNFWTIPNEQYAEAMIDITKPAGQGIVCPRSKCRHSLDVRVGQWVSTGKPDAQTKGYHLPQIIFPHNVIDPVGWNDFVQDYKGIDGNPAAKYSRTQIYNEMLGLSYDVGGRLITQRELEECCDPNATFLHDWRDCAKHELALTFGGVDWGIGGERSFTMVCVIAPDAFGRLRTIFARKFPAGDPLKQIDEITDIFRRFKVAKLGCDYGNGFVYNQHLRVNLGLERVYIYQYVASKLFIAVNKQGGHFTVDRTNIMNLVFMEMKQKKYVFPKLEISQMYFDDILSIYEEEIMTPSGHKKVFRRSHSQPDDFMHALLYASLAYKFHFGDPTLNLENVTRTYDPASLAGGFAPQQMIYDTEEISDLETTSGPDEFG